MKLIPSVSDVGNAVSQAAKDVHHDVSSDVQNVVKEAAKGVQNANHDVLGGAQDVDKETVHQVHSVNQNLTSGLQHANNIVADVELDPDKASKILSNTGHAVTGIMGVPGRLVEGETRDTFSAVSTVARDLRDGKSGGEALDDVGRGATKAIRDDDTTASHGVAQMGEAWNKNVAPDLGHAMETAIEKATSATVDSESGATSAVLRSAGDESDANQLSKATQDYDKSAKGLSQGVTEFGGHLLTANNVMHVAVDVVATVFTSPYGAAAAEGTLEVAEGKDTRTAAVGAGVTLIAANVASGASGAVASQIGEGVTSEIVGGAVGGAVASSASDVARQNSVSGKDVLEGAMVGGAGAGASYAASASAGGIAGGTGYVSAAAGGAAKGVSELEVSAALNHRGVSSSDAGSAAVTGAAEGFGINAGNNLTETTGGGIGGRAAGGAVQGAIDAAGQSVGHGGRVDATAVERGAAEGAANGAVGGVVNEYEANSNSLSASNTGDNGSNNTLSKVIAHEVNAAGATAFPQPAHPTAVQHGSVDQNALRSHTYVTSASPHSSTKTAAGSVSNGMSAQCEREVFGEPPVPNRSSPVGSWPSSAPLPSRSRLGSDEILHSVNGPDGHGDYVVAPIAATGGGAALGFVVERTYEANGGLHSSASTHEYLFTTSGHLEEVDASHVQVSTGQGGLVEMYVPKTKVCPAGVNEYELGDGVYVHGENASGTGGDYVVAPIMVDSSQTVVGYEVSDLGAGGTMHEVLLDTSGTLREVDATHIEVTLGSLTEVSAASVTVDHMGSAQLHLSDGHEMELTSTGYFVDSGQGGMAEVFVTHNAQNDAWDTPPMQEHSELPPQQESHAQNADFY